MFLFFLHNKLFQILLHLYRLFEWIYCIVSLHGAVLNATEHASMGTGFVSL
jgi:hypothetical protein